MPDPTLAQPAAPGTPAAITGLEPVVPTPTPAIREEPPEYRFDKVNQRMKEAEARATKSETELAKMKETQKKAEDKALAKQGEYEKLAESRGAELETTNAELARYRERTKAEWEGVKANIPEDMLKRFQEGDSNEIVVTNLAKYKEFAELGLFGAGTPGSPDNRPSVKPLVPTGKFGPNGEYESQMQFAAKDPEGFGKWVEKKESGGPIGTFQEIAPERPTTMIG